MILELCNIPSNKAKNGIVAGTIQTVYKFLKQPNLETL